MQLLPKIRLSAHLLYGDKTITFGAGCSGGLSGWDKVSD